MRKFTLVAATLLCLYIQVVAQNKSVSGRITDSRNGTPLAGATVTGKGTSISTQSSPDGSFSISVPASVKALVFSSVGFATTEVSLTGKTNVEVSMVVGGQNLDEVVVVAYGAQKKKEVTGASATVKAPELANIPSSSVDMILQGKVCPKKRFGQPGLLSSHCLAFVDIRLSPERYK